MGNQNRVHGPANRPLFDPPGVRGQRVRYLGTPLLEASWSYSGDVTPAGLFLAAESPPWIAGSTATVRMIRTGYALNDNALTGAKFIAISLLVNHSPLTTWSIGSGSPDHGRGAASAGDFTGDPQFSVIASVQEEETTDTEGTFTVCHGLSFFMWYQLVASD